MKYIYAIRSAMDTVKFGSSQNPIARLSSLQTGNDEVLILAALCRGHEVEGRVLEEVMIHVVCADEYLRGEWYRYQRSARAMVDVMQRAMIDDYGHYVVDFLYPYIPDEVDSSNPKNVLLWALNSRPQRPLHSI